MKKFERVLFLDFDGVLHPTIAIRGAKPPLSPEQILTGWPKTFEHVPILENLLKGFDDVSIIASTSWRIFFNDEQLGRFFPSLSRFYEGSIGSPCMGRAEAINNWVKDNKPKDFAILDDKCENFPGYWPNLILCRSELGILEQRVQLSLLRWLNSETGLSQIDAHDT
ncbi:hypothetical protein F3K36_14830 [Delftia sp. BR1]|uniref:HAD domain-containing protein n=1 Tax=Delftia acidovorans TaxID=80866 RepID=UPI00124850CF|nr:HAD domain-containing protein [Delftia acidovorans]KAA9174128.1 hypothetical protein F3K36_14830 [Delftia sp. BR1]